MRVLVFGASGTIGSEVRREARAAGHELRLFARDPARLGELSAGETVVAGDIADPTQVAAAVAGVDAVISALGPTSNTADQVALFETFATSLVGAMQAAGVRRLVALSGAACALPGERKPLRARIASTFVRLAVRHVVAAKQRELEIIAASDLDWIAPRPPRVQEAPAGGHYRVGSEATGLRITAADLAAFMVAQLTDRAYLRQAPFISN